MPTIRRIPSPLVCETTPAASTQLPHAMSAPGLARRFVTDYACAAHGRGQVDNATLLVSEAVTNAVLYGAPPVALSIDCTGDALTIRVGDASSNLPIVEHPKPDEDHGRGMLLIDMLADEWGTELTAKGKEVWFVLR